MNSLNAYLRTTLCNMHMKYVNILKITFFLSGVLWEPVGGMQTTHPWKQEEAFGFYLILEITSVFIKFYIRDGKR